MLVKATLEENVAMVNRDLVLFQAAAKEILYNPLLVEFLVDVVRPFGNELNRAGGKKDAVGIKISGLLKLGATKTADNSMTSLYYIVSVLHKHKPKLLQLCSAFPNVKLASKLSMKGLEDNFKLVKEGTLVIEKGMTAATKSGDAVFIEKVSPFSSAFGDTVGSMEKSLGNLKKSLDRCAEYLGEKGRDMSKAEDLCKEWTDFIALIATTWQEFREKQEKAAKALKEKLAKEEAERKKAEKKAASKPSKSQPSIVPPTEDQT